MEKKIIIGIVALVIVIVGVLLLFNSRTETTDKVTLEEEERLYIVTSPWKPYMYEEDGEYKGIYVDIMDLIFDNLDIEYKFEIFPWPRAYKMGEEGVADGLLGASYKPERESVVRYTPEQKTMVDKVNKGAPIGKAYLGIVLQSFFVRKVTKDSFIFDSPEQIAESGYRVGVNKDYGYAPVVWESNWTLVEHITEKDSFEALANGKIDLYITPKAVGLTLVKDLGLSEEIGYIEKPIAQTPNFLLFTKASNYPNLDELIKKVDEELIRIHESGEYDEIYRRYTG